jgi:hypothetical protein
MKQDLDYIKSMIEDDEVLPLEHFLPDFIKSKFTYETRLEAKRSKRVLIGIAKIMSNLECLRHLYIDLHTDYQDIQTKVFRQFVEDIVIAIDKNEIYWYFGRSSQETELRNLFFTRIWKGNNLEKYKKYGCSAFIISRPFAEAYKNWLGQFNASNIHKLITLKKNAAPEEAEIAEYLPLTEADINRYHSLALSYAKNRDFTGVAIASSLISAITPENTLPQYYKNSRTGRLNGVGRISFQTMQKKYRHAFLATHHDYDVSACAQTLLLQRYQQTTGLNLESLENYIENKQIYRDSLQKTLNITSKQAKSTLTAILFGQQIQLSQLRKINGNPALSTALIELDAYDFLSEHIPVILDLQEDCKKLAIWSSKQDSKYGQIKNAVGAVRWLTRYSKNKSLAHKYFGFERQIINEVQLYCKENNISAVWIHDGFITNTAINEQEIYERLNRKINFNIKLEYNIL